MQFKQSWKSSDLEMDAWSLKKEVKRNNNQLKFSKLKEMQKDKWNKNEANMLDNNIKMQKQWDMN